MKGVTPPAVEPANETTSETPSTDNKVDEADGEEDKHATENASDTSTQPEGKMPLPKLVINKPQYTRFDYFLRHTNLKLSATAPCMMFNSKKSFLVSSTELVLIVFKHLLILLSIHKHAIGDFDHVPGLTRCVYNYRSST